ncbi:hypothetical protein [Pseudooceanicola sp. MF1-13]|uniref:hypothetical protein n=1 Tax=Pseudooceanicola sp. MF1-13 TaxID=3379095 RepID=UPI00389261DD
MTRHQRIAAFVGRIERGEVEGVTTEADRIAAVKDMGALPPTVGPDVQQTAARGPVRVFDMIGPHPVGENGVEYGPAGHRGRKTVQLADAFDVMAARAAARGAGSPFTAEQIGMGRFYRNLVERYESAGMRASSMDATTRGGGGPDGFMDALLADRQRIMIIRRRIGDGVALSMRKVRPSRRATRGTTRSVILDRRAVDAICLQEATLTDVLRAHGWAANGTNFKALTRAVGRTLERMAGPMRGQPDHSFTSDFARSIWDAANGSGDSDTGDAK